MLTPAPVAAPEMRALSAVQIAAAVNGGELDPAALVRACMEEIEARYDLHAVLARCYADAIRRARRGVRGPLAGVPLLVSDTIDTAGLTTALGTVIHSDRIPRCSATAVARLEHAGALVIGKANVDELGWGVSGQNPHWGFAANPRRPDHVSGGACGGAAAGLAANVCALALGTDADGGLRIPAACCTTVAFKPAPARVPRDGCLPLAPSFDAVGPMARTVRDCAVAYAVLSDSPPAEPRIAGLTVAALAPTPALERLVSLGARVVNARLPRPAARLMPAFLLECAISQRDAHRRRDALGPVAQDQLEAARNVPAIDAWEAREALVDWRRRAQEQPAVDLLVSPTLGAPVPSGDAPARWRDGSLTRFTEPFGLLGWPAIAVGDLQIAGRDERLVLGAALAYEEAFGVPD